MDLAAGLLALLALAAVAALIVRILRPASPADCAIRFPLILAGEIVVCGFVLSALERLGSARTWAAAGVLLLLPALAAALALPRLRRLLLAPRSLLPRPSPLRRLRELPPGRRAVLFPMLAIALAVAALNLSVALFTAPHNWDSMTYRLARVAHYIQNGSLSAYDAAYAQQVLVQKNAPILLLFAFVAADLRENLAQTVQFAAYLVSILCVWGIGREIGLRRSAALFAALVFALLTECLMESTTTQDDLILAACLGSSVYSLFRFRSTRRRAHLCFTALGIGLGLGTKASFLIAAPSLALVALYLLSGRPNGPPSARAKPAVFFLAALLLSLAVFALPSGYLESWRIFGHPLGPPSFRALQSFSGRSPAEMLRNGPRHLLRSSVDFLSLDGLPPVAPVRAAQALLRLPARALLEAAGIDLEADIVEPWFWNVPPISHEDYSSWGILGFALIWPALLLLLVGAVRNRDGRILALAVLLFLFAHAFSGIYDFAGRGRYVLMVSVLAAPAAGLLCSSPRRPAALYASAVALVGCLSALTAVLFRFRSPILFDESVFLREADPRWAEARPFPLETRSVFLRDRLGQVLRDGPIFEAPLRRFEELVPPTAAVAVCLNPNVFEYPLFGYRLTRRIIPLNSFWRGRQAIPPGVGYLLWEDDFDPAFGRQTGDVHLGKDLYLRKLK